MDYIKVRNWEKWQTYRKDRGQPPWIKIHRCVMRNPDWVSLADAERGQLVAIWLLAADHDGAIPASPEIIKKLCFLSTPPDLNKFTDLGFLENGWRQPDANVAPNGRQHDAPDKNRIEKNICPFSDFWTIYPKHEKKKDAEKAWNALSKTKQEKALTSLPPHLKKWEKTEKQFIPLAASWLRGERWNDEITKPETQDFRRNAGFCAKCGQPSDFLLSGLCRNCT